MNTTITLKKLTNSLGLLNTIDEPRAEAKNEQQAEAKNEPRVKKNAIITLVMKGDRYVAGALVFGHSVRNTETKCDIVCMVTPDVSDHALQQLSIVFDHVKIVDYIRAETQRLRNRKIEGLYGSWKSIAYTKWNVLQFTEYNKVLFMDSDLIVVKNIDHLFNLRAPAATFSISQIYPYAKRGIRNPYMGNIHGRTVKPQTIDKGFRESFVCIGTTVLLEPDMDIFDTYIRMLRRMEPFGIGRCINGSDEQSITWLYHSVLKERWTHIHQAYNMIPWKQSIWLAGCRAPFDEPFVWHYVCKDKPWEQPKNAWEDLAAWWSVADSLVCTYPELAGFAVG